MTRTEARGTEAHRTETLPPLTLTPEQAAAIAAALATHPDGPYSGARLSALQAVLAALEPDPRRRAELLAGSLLAGAEVAETAQIRAVVERGVVARRVVELRYRDGTGTASRREVEPQLLARSSDHWFLVAWCRQRQAPRWFRMDRIAGARLTDEAAPRRDPALFGAPSDTHPAGRAIGRRPAPSDPRRGLRVLPGGRP